MFSLYKKPSDIPSLYKKYRFLMQEYHNLSRYNRTESDRKYEEAQAILREIETIQAKNN